MNQLLLAIYCTIFAQLGDNEPVTPRIKPDDPRVIRIAERAVRNEILMRQIEGGPTSRAVDPDVSSIIREFNESRTAQKKRQTPLKLTISNDAYTATDPELPAALKAWKIELAKPLGFSVITDVSSGVDLDRQCAAVKAPKGYLLRGDGLHYRFDIACGDLSTNCQERGVPYAVEMFIRTGDDLIRFSREAEYELDLFKHSTKYLKNDYRCSQIILTPTRKLAVVKENGEYKTGSKSFRDAIVGIRAILEDRDDK